MRPDISEFSYGYALTDELMHSAGSPIKAAPVFPSLYAEGQTGGGWDVKINRGLLPLFLQFKLTDYMATTVCREHRSGKLRAPCYRMHLRPLSHSRQHDLLQELEKKGNKVFYCAPAFHTASELDDAYVNHAMRHRSFWIKPSQIGKLDDKPHHVSFASNGTWAVFSEPRRGRGSLGYAAFETDMQEELGRDRPRRATREYFEELAENVLTIAEKNGGRDEDERRPQELRTRLSNVHPLFRASYYAATFLECTLFLVGGASEVAG